MIDSMNVVATVTKFFSDHGVAILVCWAVSTAVFYWMGGFTPAAPRVPDKIRRKIEVGGPYTREEVSKHDREDDVWIVVKDQKDGVSKVYDVTEYVEVHPGGDAILRNAGGDSTEGFYGPQHPPTTVDVLREYYIGDLQL